MKLFKAWFLAFPWVCRGLFGVHGLHFKLRPYNIQLDT